MAPTITSRDFTVATFVVAGDRVLLLFHRKLQMWLPPGGHIEPNELPDEAAVREVLEEAGIAVRLLPEIVPMPAGPLPLARPEGIQLERIGPGHEHIDLIYFVRPVAGAPRAPAEEAFIWVTADQLRRNESLPVAACGIDLPVTEDVRVLGLAAIAAAAG